MLNIASLNHTNLFKMKKILNIIILFSSLHLVLAQQQIYVSGQILDSVSKKGLESCAIGFFNAQKVLITGTSSDDKGYFELAIYPGKYEMVIDYIGYKKKSIPVFIRQNNQFLGTYQLSPDKNLLNSVQIKAKSKSFKIDKEVYIITKKLKVAAANTDDVLDKIQGVTYDRYNNQIKVDGQTKVKILVDGLEKEEEYIRSINPERLKKIEIIRDPSGKYALDGYVAVINVILKKNYTGLELNLSNQLVIDADAEDKSHLLPISNSSLGLTYTYNKLNVYGKYNLFSNDFYFPSITSYKYNNGDVIVKQPVNGENNLLKKLTNDRFTFGVDYYINPRHTLSFETGIRNIFFNKDFISTQYLVTESLQNNNQNSYFLQNNIDGNSKSNYQSLFYIGKFGQGRELNMDLSFSNYQNTQDKKFLSDHLLYRKEILKDEKKAVKFNAEYSFSLNEKSSMQAGYGFYHQQNTNYLESQPQSNIQNFKWQDTRHKAFVYYAKEFSPKWSFKIGLAGELSNPKAFGQETLYFIYQPYLDIKYGLSKNIELKLKYRTESDYPGLSQANPNTIYIDPQNVNTGNPSLAPQVIHQIALRTNFFGGALFIEPYYHFSNNYIGEISHLQNDGIIEHTYENLGHYKHYGVNGNIAIPFSKKVFWSTNFDFYHSSLEYNNQINSFKDFSLESNLVYVDRSKGLTSGFIYQRGMNKYITAQGYHKWNNDYLGFLIQKSLMKRKLNIMLLYMLPVDFGIDYIQEEYTKTSQYETLTQYDIHLLKNVIVFRINYRFSKGKATRKTNKHIEDETPKSEKKGLF